MSGRESLPLHSVSVAGAVVREDGRVLAIRRSDNGRWELPGGVLGGGDLGLLVRSSARHADTATLTSAVRQSESRATRRNALDREGRHGLTVHR